MAISHHALYSAVIEDLKPYLSIDQEISAYLGGGIPDYPDAGLEQAASVNLLRNIFKKYVSTVSPDADKLALAKFTESNRLCERWSWSRDTWSLRDELLVGIFKDTVHEVFSDSIVDIFDLCELSKDGDLGSGANIDSRGTDLYTKLYGSTLSCSKPAIFDLYQRYVASNDRWKRAEFIRTLHFGHGPHINDSKLSFVPKSNDISRTICTEPTLNMWYQRSLSKRLERLLYKRFGIDLSSQQDVNRELCRIGSKYGSFATIDLASASDSISLKLLEDILPKGILSCLKFFRSSRTVLPDGSLLELQMVSSMGNGFTFSLQTLLFCCMVEAVYKTYDIAMSRNWHGGEFVRPGNFAVYGDDIIINAQLFEPMIRLLELCGFRANKTKSFSKGPFRESCGVDFHDGHNIRAVYIKDLSNEFSRFAVINLLRYWQARLRISLKRTLTYLIKFVRPILIPRAAPIEGGIHVPFSVIQRKRLDANASFLYRCLTPVPDEYLVNGESVVCPRLGRKKIFNPDGLLLYALYGGLRNGSFAVRSSHSRFRLRTFITPNWDMKPLGRDPLDHEAWARWNSESMALIRPVLRS